MRWGLSGDFIHNNNRIKLSTLLVSFVFILLKIYQRDHLLLWHSVYSVSSVSLRSLGRNYCLEHHNRERDGFKPLRIMEGVPVDSSQTILFLKLSSESWGQGSRVIDKIRSFSEELFHE